MLALCSFMWALGMRDRQNRIFRPTRLMIPAKVMLSLRLDWDGLPRAFPYHRFTVCGHTRKPLHQP